MTLPSHTSYSRDSCCSSGILLNGPTEAASARSVFDNIGMNNKIPSAGSTGGKPAMPVVRGKGKALNAIAAASGRDPAAIVKSVTEAEALAKAATAARTRAVEEEVRRAAARERVNAKNESTVSQIFNRLSPQEKFRFICFRRCGFASKPMEKFVTKMLVDATEKRHLVRTGTLVGLGCRLSVGVERNIYEGCLPSNNSTASATVISDADSSSRAVNRKRKKHSTKQVLINESKRRLAVMDQPWSYFPEGPLCMSRLAAPSLANLVVANSVSEIVSVVSTLAKCYGQRLVTAAKRVADAEDKEKNFIGTSLADDTISSLTLPRPLQPRHFIEAQKHRARAGLDPDFWLAGRVGHSEQGLVFHKGGEGIAEAAALGMVDRDSLCYFAALGAQDEHDRESEKDDDKTKVNTKADTEESKDEEEVAERDT